VRFLPFNDSTLLVELPDLEHTLALLHSLQTEAIVGIEELIPAARTILVRFTPQRIARKTLQDAIARRSTRARANLTHQQPPVEIPVIYDGEDLAEVAQMLALSVEEVIQRHTDHEWFVAFTGFSPGFAYLAGGDPIFNVPRRSTPRTKVPTGSVSLAGTFSAIYPRESPGGWQLIGTTTVPMWDVTRARPALLELGQRLRFVDTGRRRHASTSKTATKPATTSTATPSAQQTGTPSPAAASLIVRQTGLITMFQDLGRPGLRDQGVCPSGAMDHAALRAANRLVGNASGEGALETVGAGLSLQSQGDTVVAVTGADAILSLRTAQGRQWQVPRYQAIALADGDRLTIGACQAGLRSYVAVRGGFAVEPVLGSVATDTLSHLGPPPLAVGQHLVVRSMHRHPAVASPELPPEHLPRPAQEVVLDILPGPRADWFTPQALQRLMEQRWQVTPQSNRVGLRLCGEIPLDRTAATQHTELPSEGLVCGAIQIPPSGQPVLFLRDHSSTGGYPVIACVAAHHLDLAGQIPAGASIRFNSDKPGFPCNF